MTTAAIERLEYSSGQDNPAWDRFALSPCLQHGKAEAKPSCSESTTLDAWEASSGTLDTRKLGADLFSFTPATIAKRVAVGSVPIKARLLDQSRIAGVGNLIADETLWRSGIHPERQGRVIDLRRTNAG